MRGCYGVIKNIRWPVVLIAFLFLISVFYGFQWYQQKQVVEEPLTQLFAKREEVKGVEISQQGDTLEIVLELEYVDNLREYESIINKEVSKIMGNRKYQVSLLDSRNKQLEEIFYRVHYHLQEAAVTGNFVEMSERVGEIMSGYSFEDYRLIVGEEKIYFQVKQSGHYLFEIVPRFPGSNGQESMGESVNQ